MLNRPADLTVTDTWIATMVELKCQCGIGRRTDNVLGLMDIRQGVRVGAGYRKASGASRGSCSGIADLTCSGVRLAGKGAQPSRALSPIGKPPDAFNRRTGRESEAACLSYTDRALSAQSAAQPPMTLSDSMLSVKYLDSRFIILPVVRQVFDVHQFRITFIQIMNDAT